jgi:uncharacterized protein (TIGR02246 family)
MSEDERAIRDVVETWMRASQGGDLDAVLALMTEDVVFTVPGQEPFGREAFAAAAAPGQAPRIDGSNEIVELQVQGDWAFTRNRIDITAHPPGASPVRRYGYTLTLYRKCADGRWRLMRDANLLAVKG